MDNDMLWWRSFEDEGDTERNALTKEDIESLTLLQPIAARFSMVEMKRINPFQINPFSLKLGE